MDDKKNMWQFLKTEGKGVLVLFLFVFVLLILLLILSVNIEATYPKTAKVSQLIAGILGVSGTINILLRASFWKDTVEDVLLSLSNNFEGDYWCKTIYHGLWSFLHRTLPGLRTSS